MNDDSPFKNDFLFPRVQQQETMQNEIQALARFRRALRKEDQIVIDDLLKHAESHASKSFLLERMTPFEYILLTMLLEQHKEIERLKNLVHETY